MSLHSVILLFCYLVILLFWFCDLVDAQCQEMGLLHDETLDTIQLWSETLALLKRWSHLEEVLELLESAQSKVNHPNLAVTIRQIEALCSISQIQSQTS